jgi:hypothetical protein
MLLALSIGGEQFKRWMIETKPAFTEGYVDEYRSYARDINNRIEYTYNVEGKTFHGKFRSNELPTDLKGKRIVIQYSDAVHRWSLPLYQRIVVDSIRH